MINGFTFDGATKDPMQQAVRAPSAPNARAHYLWSDGPP
jgi:hypothetical protein